MDLRDQIKQELIKRKKDRGFGDTFERFTTFTGIKRLVKWWYGDKDCGCDRRKDLWNKWFPYNDKEATCEEEINKWYVFTTPKFNQIIYYQKVPENIKIIHILPSGTRQYNMHGWVAHKNEFCVGHVHMQLESNKRIKLYSREVLKWN